MWEAIEFVVIGLSWAFPCFFLWSMLWTVLVGQLVVPVLRRLKVCQTVSEDAPKRHQNKAGTPTMGGIIILIVALFAGFSLGVKGSSFVLLTTLAMLCFGLLGFMDDYLMVAKKRALGLKARYKFAGQAILAAFFVYFVYLNFGTDTTVSVPWTGYQLDLGLIYYPFIILFIVGIANAVNLTDGLDGLAAGTAGIALLSYLLICILLGFGDSEPERLAERMSLGLYCSFLSGACLGFLWFNFYPAQVFMGDTGSLALGAALAIVAILTKTELLLLLIGGVFVIEALSVIAQVIYFKSTGGKRIFKMSPLHHHFELCGIPEPQIVIRFWLAGLVFGLLGLLWLLYSLRQI